MIARRQGAVSVFYYAYVAYLILAAQEHDALEDFSGVLLRFVLPITMITLVVSVSRPQRSVTDS